MFVTTYMFGFSVFIHKEQKCVDQQFSLLSCVNNVIFRIWDLQQEQELSIDIVYRGVGTGGGGVQHVPPKLGRGAGSDAPDSI